MQKNKTSIIHDDLSIHNNPMTRKVDSTFENVKLFHHINLLFHQQLEDKKKNSIILRDKMHSIMNLSGTKFNKEMNLSSVKLNKKQASSYLRDNKTTTLIVDKSYNKIRDNKTTVFSVDKSSNQNMKKSNSMINIKFNLIKETFNDSNTLNSIKKSTKDIFDSISSNNAQGIDSNNKKVFFKNVFNDNKLKSQTTLTKKKLEFPEIQKMFMTGNIQLETAKKNNNEILKMNKSLNNLKTQFNKSFMNFENNKLKIDDLKNEIEKNYEKNDLIIKNIIRTNYSKVVNIVFNEDARPPKKEIQTILFNENSKKKNSFKFLNEESEMSKKEKILNFDKCANINDLILYKYRDLLLTKYNVKMDKKFSKSKIKSQLISKPINENHEKIKRILIENKSEKKIILDKLENNSKMRKIKQEHKIKEKHKIEDNELDELFSLNEKK